MVPSRPAWKSSNTPDELCAFAADIDFAHVAKTITDPAYAGYRPAVAA